jgi:hypothetical protein
VDDPEHGMVYQRRNEGIDSTLSDINIKEKVSQPARVTASHHHHLGTMGLLTERLT